MTQPYQTPWFQHSAEFTLTLTVVIAGGARPSTASRRARQTFERVANHTTRLKDVVAVTAVGGPSHHGQVSWPQPVAFPAANTEPGTVGSGKLLRYCSASELVTRFPTSTLTTSVPNGRWPQANDAARRRRDADRRRRRAVGCANAHPALLQPAHRFYGCVYCEPEEHLLALRRQEHPQAHGSALERCLCGQPAPHEGPRCTNHRDVGLEVLEGDPPALNLLEDYLPLH
jgi:hypothetical protein